MGDTSDLLAGARVVDEFYGRELWPYGPLREADARFCPFCYSEGPTVTCSVQAHWPEPDRTRTLYLSGVECPQTREMEAAGLNVGLMTQPGTHYSEKAARYRFFAADNGCFNAKTYLGDDAWYAWLQTLPGQGEVRRCLFATAPDVLGNAVATWERSVPWLERIRDLGIPAALVGQNGLESFAPAWDEPERWDVLFVGGDDEWKLGQDAADCMEEALRLGKWVHVGRVNSWKRTKLMIERGADSVDGTFLGFGPKTNGPRLEGWLRRMDAEVSLF